MSLRSIILLLLFATVTMVKSREIKMSKNSFETQGVDALREKSVKSVIPKKLYQDDNATYDSSRNREKIARVKRLSQDRWIVKDFEGFPNLMKFQALVVRDEKIPPCGMTANVSTDSRYFMCSGAILTDRHAITTASCVHFAHIFEHPIDADMAILVGAATDYNQVIKIARIEMHPYYDYNVESIHYADHNLAILHLECPICKGFASIPKLPRNPYQDLGHLCCPDRCKLLTVVQRSNNHHVARLLRTKHLPSPEHREEEEHEEEKDPPDNNTESSRRRSIRSPGKLAAAPLFFARENRYLNLTVDENLENRHVKRNQFSYGNGRRSEKKKYSPDISDANKEILEDFTKKLVDAMISRLEDFLRSGENPETSTMSTPGVGTNLTENATSADMVDALVNTLVSGVLDKIDVTDDAVDESEKDILETYVECPPLGAPVIRDDILVGMVAYTCDDVQDWVEWKYVDISQNMDWIMDRLQNGSGDSTKDFLNQKRRPRSNWSISTTCSDSGPTVSNPCVTSGNGESRGACETWNEGGTRNSKIIPEGQKNPKNSYDNLQFNRPINGNG